MFDKTIKIEIDGALHTVTNEEVQNMILVDKDYYALEAKYDEVKWTADSLQERLDAANAKLTQYGHMSGF